MPCRPRNGQQATFLWEFLLRLLDTPSEAANYIRWVDEENGVFKLLDSKVRVEVVTSSTDK